MCDVLFITPNCNGDFCSESLGTLLLATILKNNGVKCKVLPFGRIANVRNFDVFIKNALVKIDELQPKIVSMYTRCDTYHISLRLAEQIKLHRNDICIVFGGPQSDTTSTEVISHIPYVDYVCCGEGENTIYPFFSSILKGTPDLSVPGLVYRQNGEVMTNPRPELIKDLDILPMIDYKGTFLSDYPEDIHSIPFRIDVGRGCPFGCSYCSTQAFWGRKYRLKSPARIVDEIKKAHDEFGISRFAFAHDMFTLNRKTVIETCNLIRKLDYPIKWQCSARLDCLDPELIDTMVDAGMVRIFVGIETGSKRMQKLVHKNLNLDKVMDLLIYLRNKKLYVDTSFVYGFPEEMHEDLSQTLSLMAKILYNQCGVINTHLCAFLPKTELSELYQAQLTRTYTYSNFTGDIAIKECEDIIDHYPSLFPQLMEYRTELRDGLKHFGLFMRVWTNLAPIYQYISEQYPEDSLINMYYDFVDANREALEKYSGLLSKDAAVHLTREDKLHLRFANDPNYDLIADCHRMKITELSDEVKNGTPVAEIYCFDPRERKRVRRIQEYTRCFASVNYVDNQMMITVVPL